MTAAEKGWLMYEKASRTGAGGAETERATLRERLGLTAREFQEMGEIGAMFYQQGNLEKARTIFEGLVEMDPLSGAAHSALGALLTRTRQDERALEHLNRAIELSPDQIAPRVNRAEVLLRQQKMEQAVADLRRAIELDPKETDAGANRARAMVLGIHEAIQAHGSQA